MCVSGGGGGGGGGEGGGGADVIPSTTQVEVLESL